MSGRLLTRNLQELIANPVYLHGVKRITVKYAKTGPGQAGARKFIVSHFPALKYHNFDVEFAIDKQVEHVSPEVTVEKGDGSVEVHAVEGIHEADILELVTRPE